MLPLRIRTGVVGIRGADTVPPVDSLDGTHGYGAPCPRFIVAGHMSWLGRGTVSSQQFSERSAPPRRPNRFEKSPKYESLTLAASESFFPQVSRSAVLSSKIRVPRSGLVATNGSNDPPAPNGHSLCWLRQLGGIYLYFVQYIGALSPRWVSPSPQGLH